MFQDTHEIQDALGEFCGCFVFLGVCVVWPFFKCKSSNYNKKHYRAMIDTEG